VRDGAWWWHRTSELLQERGVGSATPTLPSRGEAGDPAGTGGPGLPEDVAAVRQVLRSSDEPTVVVAHSYGGIVAAEAAAEIGSVSHLLLVSSYLPEVGQSLSSFCGPRLRSSTSTSTPARSASARTPWPRRSCRTATPTRPRRRRVVWRGRACT
jgi:pimeloyl-ACP methyl ester carboxylesterase